MTEHKFTDDEVIRALECCKSGYCIARNCPFYDATEDDDIGACTSRLSSNALDLINRQKAEIERLQKSIELMKGAKCVYSYDGETLEYCISSPCPISKTVDQIKAEAIKEFAERLKERFIDRIGNANDSFISYSIQREIDNLTEEFIGTNND